VKLIALILTMLLSAWPLRPALSSVRIGLPTPRELVTLTAEQAEAIEAALNDCLLLKARERQCPSLPPVPVPIVEQETPRWMWALGGLGVGIVGGLVLGIALAR
jgi:hypothetical protein